MFSKGSPTVSHKYCEITSNHRGILEQFKKMQFRKILKIPILTFLSIFSNLHLSN